MKQYFRSLFPPEFYTRPEYFRALALGLFFLLLLLLQLFHFEKFYPITYGFSLPGGTVMAAVVAGLIPLLEAAALPYLFSMDVAARVRQISRVAVVAAPLLWLAIVVWLAISGNSLAEVGLFGSTVVTHYGWWVLLFVAMLVASAVIVVRELPRLRTHA